MVEHAPPAQRHPMPVQRGLDGVGVQVAAQPVVELRRVATQGAEPGRPGHPAFGGGIGVEQVGVVQRLQRIGHGMACQPCRRTHRKNLFLEQLQRRAILPAAIAVAHQQVDIVVAQVAGEHLRGQAQAYLGHARAQVAQARHHPQLGKGRGGAEHQLLFCATVTEAVEHRGNLLQRLGHHREQRLTFAGQADAAVQALEQLDPEVVLELPDLLAHCCLGHAQLTGRQGDTAVAGDRFKFEEGSHRGDDASVAFVRIAVFGCFHATSWQGATRWSAPRADSGRKRGRAIGLLRVGARLPHARSAALPPGRRRRNGWPASPARPPKLQLIVLPVVRLLCPF